MHWLPSVQPGEKTWTLRFFFLFSFLTTETEYLAKTVSSTKSTKTITPVKTICRGRIGWFDRKRHSCGQTAVWCDCFRWIGSHMISIKNRHVFWATAMWHLKNAVEFYIASHNQFSMTCQFPSFHIGNGELVLTEFVADVVDVSWRTGPETQVVTWSSRFWMKPQVSSTWRNNMEANSYHPNSTTVYSLTVLSNKSKYIFNGLF